MAESAYTQGKRLDGEVTQILSRLDMHEQDITVRDSVHVLKRELTEMHGDVRDYELAETRIEQQKLGQDIQKCLAGIEMRILHLSQYNIFSPIEVAELSARIDMLRHELV